ncbi:hypothetical protein [Bradyrhizobium liaoningense]|uniref:hypothetical protein n=1 Tax=Bradyrhizobium liaoningense TaxID=43992 RepID=UPI001BA6244C|nr:hypothetical protein [Bradyrhizobium liaoningense]
MLSDASVKQGTCRQGGDRVAAVRLTTSGQPVFPSADERHARIRPAMEPIRRPRQRFFPWFSGPEQSSGTHADPSGTAGPAAVAIMHLENANEIGHAGVIAAVAPANGIRIRVDLAALPDAPEQFDDQLHCPEQ